MNGTASSRRGAARASVRRIWSVVRPRYEASASFKGSRGSAPLPRHRTGDNSHPAPAGLCSCLGGEPRFADTGLAETQDGVPFAGPGHPGDVRAQHIEFTLTVNQRFLRALAAVPGPLAAAIIP